MIVSKRIPITYVTIGWFGINAVCDDEGRHGNICRIWTRIPTSDLKARNPDTYDEEMYKDLFKRGKCHCYWAEDAKSWVISEELQTLLANHLCHLVMEDGLEECDNGHRKWVAVVADK